MASQRDLMGLRKSLGDLRLDTKSRARENNRIGGAVSADYSPVFAERSIHSLPEEDKEPLSPSNSGNSLSRSTSPRKPRPPSIDTSHAVPQSPQTPLLPFPTTPPPKSADSLNSPSGSTPTSSNTPIKTATSPQILLKAYPRFRVARTTSTPALPGSGFQNPSSRPASILGSIGPQSPTRLRRKSSTSSSRGSLKQVVTADGESTFGVSALGLPSGTLLQFTPQRRRKSRLSFSASSEASDDTQGLAQDQEHERDLRTREAEREKQRETEMARKRVRAEKGLKVVREICESEERFGEGLRLVVELFLDPLTEAASTGSPVVSKEVIKLIFGNIREIHALSEQMLTALRAPLDDFERRKETPTVKGVDSARPLTAMAVAAVTTGSAESVGKLQRSSSTPTLAGSEEKHEVLRISHILLSHLPYLSLYYPYITAFPCIPTLLNDLYTNNPTFTSFIRKQESLPRCNKLGLSHWLLTIVQRIPRWTMLIDSLLKVKDDKVEKEALQRAWQMSEKITSNINTRLKEQTAMLTLVNLQKAFYGLPRPLVTPARRLLKKGVLTSLEAVPRHIWLFLFNDVLVCAAASRGLAITTSILSHWIYNAEGSLSAFALSMSHALATASSSSMPGSGAAGGKSARPLSIIEDSFECLEWVELEEMTVFGLEGEREAIRRERTFQFRSPLASMELLTESRDEKDSWLMALNEAKYSRLADLQTLKQTATMRQAKRRSLQPASRLSSSTFSNTSARSEPIAEVEGDSYNAPIVEINGPAAKQCATCKRSFSLLVPPLPCMLACGKLYCSTCASHTFTISDDPAGKPRYACDNCYARTFLRETPQHELLESHSAFTLSRHHEDAMNQDGLGLNLPMTASTSTVWPPAKALPGDGDTVAENGMSSEPGRPSEAEQRLKDILRSTEKSP